MARESVVGNRIFERVEEMLSADSELTQQAAFAALSTEMGKKPSTIGANYYRVARNRKQSEAQARREARAARREATEPTPVRRGPDRNSQNAASLEEMAQVIHQQIDLLVKQYREEHAALNQVREVVGG